MSAAVAIWPLTLGAMIPVVHGGPAGVDTFSVCCRQFQGVVVRVHGTSQSREVEKFWEKPHSYWISHMSRQ